MKPLKKGMLNTGAMISMNAAGCRQGGSKVAAVASGSSRANGWGSVHEQCWLLS